MKFLFLNKSQGYILATIMGLVFLGSCYFFIYLPANEKKVQAQRFRTLQNIDRNIHDKIVNSASLLTNLLNAYDAKSKNYLDEYIRNYPDDKLYLSPITLVPFEKIKQNDSLQIEVNNATHQVTLTLNKISGIDTNKLVPQISLKYSFDQFVAGLLPDVVFDEYLVFNSGSIVYESFPSGIGKVKEDSLLSNTNGINGSYARNMTAGGKDYKLFLHNVTFDTSHKWVLGGLLSKDKFQKEKTAIPKNLWLFIITLLIGIMVVFPWIRLYQMGSKDRLTLFDGASSIVVSMLIMSLLFFCFFEYNTTVRTQNPIGSRGVIGSLIDTAFQKEIAHNYQLLKQYDSLQNKYKPGSIIELLNPTKFKAEKENPTDSLSFLLHNGNVELDNHINQVFWIDSLGQEQYTWTKSSINAPLNTSLKSRNYFKNINEGNPYYLNGEPEKKYFIDQVVSRTSGIFTSVISIPSVGKGLNVAAMSFNMRSLQNVVMPAGFTFAIINKSAKVLYHSIESKNLNENIISEFSDSTALLSFIQNRTRGSFSTEYFSKMYNVSISPMQHLPYYLIIFSDKSFTETRDVETYGFTFFMLLLFFLYMLLQMSITLLVAARRSFFKNQGFDTSWIGPKVSFHKDYLFISAINILLILVLVAMFKIAGLLEYIFLLSLTITYITIFINLLYYQRYKVQSNTLNWKYKLAAIRISALILFIQNIVAAVLLDWLPFFTGLFIQLILIFSGWLLFKQAYRFPLWFRELLLASKLKYYHSFAFMTFTCLIITSGLPVAYFYKASFDFEKKIATRYRQIDFANQLQEKKKSTLSGVNVSKYGYDTTGVYYDSIYISRYPLVVEKSNLYTDNDSVRINETEEAILSAFHLPTGETYARGNYYYNIFSRDSSVLYKQDSVGANYRHYTFVQTDKSGQYIKLHSFDVGYEIPAPGKGKSIWKVILYWAFFMIALIFLFQVLVNVIKKLFCLNLPHLQSWKELDQKLLANDKLNKFLLVIGLPGAHKYNYIVGKIKDETIKWNNTKLIFDETDKSQNNVFVVDMINLPDGADNKERVEQWTKLRTEVTASKYRLIIINHFEYNIQDAATNLEKLRMLESLMLNSICKIVILSTVHPLSFLDSLNEKNAKPDGTFAGVKDIERWQVLLGHYRIALLPITEKDYSKDIYNPPWLHNYCYETTYTHYLQALQNDTLEIATSFTENEVSEKVDLMVYKVQVASEYFYMYIWQSLTKEEKFLLYDLAEDNLVNSYDNYTLSMLIAKGVIVQSNGLLRIFNKGFRNFILTAIGHSEVNKIKERINESGNWRNLKTPLVIIIFSILAFLLISEQEAFSKLLTYVAALTAGVPAVLKIFSLFDKSGGKAST